ncbi:hypothetical protein HDU91_002253 [Kappamyces sp. JEL0680]|nr:hypothetical protein HDU91_002253 [Kappamyces sp. JEL0680]
MKFTASLLSALVAGQTLSNCVGKTDIFSVTTASFSPFPALKGQNVTLVASGILSGTVLPGATYKVQIKIGSANGVTVFTDSHDFCAASAEHGLACPIAPSTDLQTIEVSQLVPAAAPTGNKFFVVATVFNNVVNADGTTTSTEVACLSGPAAIASA